ncbi:MAG TPA: phosphogluconate dehydrogenase, partial [Candidatus Binatia bacterium]
MKPETVALLHPGNMGATVGAAARAGGARIVWTSQDRSSATRERAEQAGLIDVGNLPTALAQCEAVLSICPPHAAL